MKPSTFVLFVESDETALEVTGGAESTYAAGLVLLSEEHPTTQRRTKNKNVLRFNIQSIILSNHFYKI